MKKRYNSKKTYNKPFKKFGNSSGKRFNKKNYSRNKNSTYSKKRGYQTSKIKHEQYISKPIPNAQNDVYVKNATFLDFKLHPIVQKNIKNKGYIHPTQIQYQAIPKILEGSDILGLASTGSGKTAAFLLPLITKTLNNKHEKCLIIVPTRELANQILWELKTFIKGTDLMDVLIIGGASYGTQIKLLKRKPQFVIATPGRLIDLHKMEKINLKSFNNIVLDEVDQMLDMGFIHDIKLIIENLAQKKQSLFFSATINKSAEEISNNLLKNPVKIQISPQSAVSNVEQNIIKYKFNGEKINILHDLLITTEFEKVLVFSKTRKNTEVISKELQKRGHKSAAIHGEKTLGQRNKVISQFRHDNIDILVATDVAARGIDIPNISHIINYDEPANYSDYIHRIGRTGRIGKKGVALTFVR